MIVAKLPLYEEFRLKRIEENKKRMEALHLPQLSQSLRSSSSVKPSPMKKVRPCSTEKKLVVLRRSRRLAGSVTPVYREVVVQRVEIPRRISKGRNLSDRVYATDEARGEALEKAERLQAELEGNHPSFVKSMLQSHVSGGFWLGLPVHFCKSNLSKHDEVMTLVDEDGDEYQTIYLARKTGLSGGWKGFAVAHELADGDALVFQLIKPTAFKVYIMRASGVEEANNL